MLDRLAQTGQPLPEPMENAPDLLPGLSLYWRAFQDLSTCRPVGMGLCPIPWTAIDQYGRSYMFHGEQLERLHYLVRRLDSAYIELMSPKKSGDRQE